LRDGRAGFEDSVISGPFDAIDHQHINRCALRDELQSELIA
jgi:hypothetical protein